MALALAIGSQLLPAPLAAAAADTQLEYTVKAAYLFRFGGFVEWPQTAFESADGPTYLCVVGNDPFGPTLDKVVQGQRIGDRPVVVRRLDVVQSNSGCQILFVASTDESLAVEALDVVRGENVLTITDGARSPQATGIINFVISDNRVRFEIDDMAASVNGVVISSKLLDLARSTKRRG